MLTKCPECGKEVSDSADNCPNCGYGILKEKKKKQGRNGCLIVVGVIAVLAIIGSLSGNSSKKTEATSDASNATASTASTGSGGTSSAPTSNWQYSEKIDPLDDSKTTEACTVSKNEVTQDFPYHNVNATLCIRRSKKHGLDAYLYLNDKGQILCSSFEGCRVPVRFDSRPPHNFPGGEAADHSSNVIFIESAQTFVTGLKSAKSTVIQVRLFQNGDQNIVFDTAGLKW